MTAVDLRSCEAAASVVAPAFGDAKLSPTIQVTLAPTESPKQTGTRGILVASMAHAASKDSWAVALWDSSSLLAL